MLLHETVEIAALPSLSVMFFMHFKLHKGCGNKAMLSLTLDAMQVMAAFNAPATFKMEYMYLIIG
jgi:hypothetical protein